MQFHHCAHSLLPRNAGWEGIESMDCAVICILGSKIIVHQICSGYTLLAVGLYIRGIGPLGRKIVVILFSRKYQQSYARSISSSDVYP